MSEIKTKATELLQLATNLESLEAQLAEVTAATSGTYNIAENDGELTGDNFTSLKADLQGSINTQISDIEDAISLLCNDIIRLL